MLLCSDPYNHPLAGNKTFVILICTPNIHTAHACNQSPIQTSISCFRKVISVLESLQSWKLPLPLQELPTLPTKGHIFGCISLGGGVAVSRTEPPTGILHLKTLKKCNHDPFPVSQSQSKNGLWSHSFQYFEEWRGLQKTPSGYPYPQDAAADRGEQNKSPCVSSYGTIVAITSQPLSHSHKHLEQLKS